MLAAQSSKYARGMQSQCSQNFVMTSLSLQSIVPKLSFFLNYDNCDNVLSHIVECCVASRARMWWYAICFHVCASVQHQHMATPQNGVLLQRRCFDLGKIPCTLASVNSAVLKSAGKCLVMISFVSLLALIWRAAHHNRVSFFGWAARSTIVKQNICVSVFKVFTCLSLSMSICVSVCVCVGIQAF